MISFKQYILEQESMPDTITINGKERPTRNSLGKLIATDVKSIENFWKWFGDSKIVDHQHRPLVVYHGTNKNIHTFDVSKIGSRDAGFFGSGFYFTIDEDEALDYAETAVEDLGGGVANAMPLYISIKTPFNWDMSSQGSKFTIDALSHMGIIRNSVRGNSNALANREERLLFDKNVRRSSHDGVIVADDTYILEIVAFHPNQIKSAIENNGNFSTTSIKITESHQ
jgi:hypothetical protein